MRVRTGVCIFSVACAFLAVLASPVSAGAARWQPISPDDLSGQPSSVVSGQKVVVAWMTSVGSIVATTFSSTPQVSESDATTVTVVDSAGSDPVLVTAPGHEVSLAFATWHSGDRADPLNGLALASRSPDGSWDTAPVVATGMTSNCGIAGLLLPDGSPLLAANAADCEGVYPVHGSTLLGDADMIQYAPENEAMNLALARDGRGHVWIAWYTDFQGIVVRALNGFTGEPIGQDHVAPDSLWPTNDVGRVALVCKPVAPGCRVVYKAHFGSRIVSWAPHSGPPRILVTADAGISLGTFAAAYRGDGRLWLAWIDHPNFN